MRTPSTPHQILLCAFVLTIGAAAPAVAFQAQPASSPPPAPVDDAIRKQITDLKLQAMDARMASDVKKEYELYRKILTLDPNDALALTRIPDLSEALKANESKTKKERVDQADELAKKKLAEDFEKQAEQALIEAKQTLAAEPIARAETALGEAKKYTRANDPEIDRLQRALDAVKGDRLRWLVELWGGIGLLAVAAIAGVVLYFLRGTRVLEMVEGAQIGQVFVLQKNATAVGALASEVDWAIDDPLRKISRRHCDIVRQGRHYFLVDNSMNGTFLNGRPLQKGQPALLRRGDRIGLGGATTLLFR